MFEAARPIKARRAGRTSMNVIYNSEHYYLAEFPGWQGIELVDKARARGAFLEGPVETKLRASMADLAAREPTEEAVDEVLGGYDALLTQPVRLH
jgi:hypothetical protein